MSRISIDDIAKYCGTSKSTVSRAINRCSGVDYATKMRIHQIAERHGYTGDAKKGTSSIGVVLPDIPAYFWRLAYKAVGDMQRASGLRIKTGIYSCLKNDDEMLDCIDHILDYNVEIMIIASSDSERSKERIAALAKEIPVILLCEYMDIKNAFYIGSDSYRNGKSLAAELAAAYPQRRKVLAFQPSLNSATLNERIKGFCDELELRGYPRPDVLSVRKETRAYSSVIARELDAVYQKIRPEVIYCADGVLPELCLALKKLKAENSVVCLGYENPCGNKSYIGEGMIGALIRQDIYGQTKIAVEYATEYIKSGMLPDKKVTYVDSFLESFWEAGIR